MSAIDLLCVAAGGVVAWWLYLALPDLIRTGHLGTTGLAPVLASDDPAAARLRSSYGRLLDDLAGRRRVLDRRFFVVVPWEATPGRVAKEGEGLEVVEQRLRWIEECLRRLDLQPRRLSDREMAELLRRTLDPVAAVQPVGADGLADVSELVAPAAFAEYPSYVRVSERFARTIAVSRYPSRLRPGWPDALQLAVRRVLSTAALCATFPFTGTDLPARAGLLYGVNTATRSPVVLDRFALENHNAVVFATSGAGKSYLVKVELGRAVLAGHRALVIDPEGEYAPLLSSLGAAVVAIKPGAAALDPFAFAEGAPGALSARIATLTTLVDLLTGGLRPAERAAVEYAITSAYAS